MGKGIDFKNYKRRIVLLAVMCTFILFGTGIYAVVVMKVVPQDEGLLDVEYTSLTTEMCKEECHDHRDNYKSNPYPHIYTIRVG